MFEGIRKILFGEKKQYRIFKQSNVRMLSYDISLEETIAKLREVDLALSDKTIVIPEFIYADKLEATLYHDLFSYKGVMSSDSQMICEDFTLLLDRITKLLNDRKVLGSSDYGKCDKIERYLKPIITIGVKINEK